MNPEVLCTRNRLLKISLCLRYRAPVFRPKPDPHPWKIYLDMIDYVFVDVDVLLCLVFILRVIEPLLRIRLTEIKFKRYVKK